MQKQNDAMKTSGHGSLEKYTCPFIWKGSKGLLNVLLCERWVGDWTELQHIDSHSYGHNTVSFPFSWAAHPGASLGHGPHSSIFSPTGLDSNWLNRVSWGTPLLCAGSLYSILSPTNLNFLSPGLYNNLMPTLLPASVTISHSIQPVHGQGYILIFLDRMHLLFTQVHFLFWQLGRVGGQYATLSIIVCPPDGDPVEAKDHSAWVQSGTNTRRPVKKPV